MRRLIDHWRRLTNSVHPLDAETFGRHRHSFNLDFPPPAYIGDLINAPVVLLEANGGYDPVVTPSEFAGPGAVERYLDLLHSPQAVDPEIVAPYYARRNYAALISSGALVLINAVAYRSRSMSREPENRRVAELLPSTGVHRAALFTDLLPRASTGDRFVVAHRTRLWEIQRGGFESPNVHFTTNPVSADLSRETLKAISRYLNSGA
jgi:hypothetical protein